MSFFKDFKADVIQAVNELMPDNKEMTNEYDDEDMVDTLSEAEEPVKQSKKKKAKKKKEVYSNEEDYGIAPEDLQDSIDELLEDDVMSAQQEVTAFNEPTDEFHAAGRPADMDALLDSIGASMHVEDSDTGTYAEDALYHQDEELSMADMDMETPSMEIDPSVMEELMLRIKTESDLMEESKSKMRLELELMRESMAGVGVEPNLMEESVSEMESEPNLMEESVSEMESESNLMEESMSEMEFEPSLMEESMSETEVTPNLMEESLSEAETEPSLMEASVLGMESKFGEEDTADDVSGIQETAVADSKMVEEAEMEAELRMMREAMARSEAASNMMEEAEPYTESETMEEAKSYPEPEMTEEAKSYPEPEVTEEAKSYSEPEMTEETQSYKEPEMMEEAIEKIDDEEVQEENKMSAEKDIISIKSVEEKAESKKETMVAYDPSEIDSETTFITKATTITGNLDTDGSVDVIGLVVGNVKCKGKLVVGGSIKGDVMAGEIYANAAKIEGTVSSSGSVKVGVGSVIVGNVNSESAVIAGAVNGDIDVQGPVIVDSTAVIMGNIKSRSVQINNGAVIEGFCSQSYSDIDVKSFFS